MAFRITAPFSPLILLLSLIILFLSFEKERIRANSLILKLILLFYCSYLFIGLVSYFLDPSYLHPRTSLLVLLKSYLSSIVIITSFYAGSKVFIKHYGLNRLLQAIIGFSLVSVIFIAFANQLGVSQISDVSKTVESDRQSGLFKNPNEAGAMALYFVVLTLGGFSFFRKYYFILLGLIGLALYSTILSFSKSAMITGLLVLIAFLVHQAKYAPKLKLSSLFKVSLFIVVFVSSISFIGFRFFSYLDQMSYGQRTRLLRTTQILSGQIDKQTTSERDGLYSFAIEQIMNRPLLGYGLGSFHRLKNLKGANKMGVHNTQLMVFGESGIIPFLLLMLTFTLLGFSGWLNKSPGIGFIILGTAIVFFVNVAGTGHNALGARVSNALIGITIVLSQWKRVSNKRCVE